MRRTRGFDLIDAHFGYPEAIAAALLAWLFRVPFAVTLRGSELLHQRYRLRRLLLKWSLRRASCVFALSESLCDLASQFGYQPKKLHSFPMVWTQTFFVLATAKLPGNSLRVAPGVGVLATAGHLIELKGHHHVIQALRQRLDNGVDVILWIAGRVEIGA